MFIQKCKRASFAAAAACATVIVLSGCGGGGGGGMNLSPADIQAADPSRTQGAAVGAAGSLPRFGSVTQSTNRNTAGVSTDAASATFEGGGLNVEIARADASTLVLDTDDAVEDSRIPGASPSVSAHAWTTGSVTDDGATVSSVRVAWATDDPTDWLASGYWLHLSGNVRSGIVTGAEAGAFVDGPELSLSNPPDMPVSGTASYAGTAAGLYVSEIGTDVSGVARESIGIADFSGTIALSADFSARTIQGNIRDIVSSGILVDGASGEAREFTGQSSNSQIHLAATPFNPDGTFRGTGVTFTNPGLTVTESSGSWGGMFSNIPDADGDPRLVAGTFGGRATTSGGSRRGFIGFFGADKQ